MTLKVVFFDSTTYVLQTVALATRKTELKKVAALYFDPNLDVFCKTNQAVLLRKQNQTTNERDVKLSKVTKRKSQNVFVMS